MNKKLSMFFLTSILVIPVVLGANGFNLFDQILGPFVNLNIGVSYEKYAAFIDAILYFILFIGLAQAALGEKFKDNKTIPIVLGIMLAIGMCIFELKTGWSLSLLSGYAALIFFGLLLAGPYIMMKKWGANSFFAFCIAYFITFSIISGTGLLVNSEFTKTFGKDSMIMTILWILYALSIIGTIIGIIRLIKGKKDGSTDMRQATQALNNFGNGWDNAFKKQKKAEDNFVKLDSQMKAVENQLLEVDNIMRDLESKNLTLRNEQLQLLESLQRATIGTQQLQAYIRQMSARSADPAYAQYATQVQEAVSRLAQFINNLRQIIIRLDQDMQKSSELDVQQLEIDKNLPNYINTLINENNKLRDIEKDFQYVKDIDENAFNSIKSEYDILDKEISEQTTYAESLKKEINTEVLESIKKIDSDNKIILDDMLKMLDNSKLTQMRFKWINNLFETHFINEQSLAKIQQYLPTLRRNITLVIDIKKKFSDSFNSKNDAIKNKFLRIQNSIVSRFQNIVKQSTATAFNDFKKNESDFNKYRIQIQAALKKILDSKDSGAATVELNTIFKELNGLHKKFKKNIVYSSLTQYASSIIKITNTDEFKVMDTNTNKPTNVLNTVGISKLNEISNNLNNLAGRMGQIEVKEAEVKKEGETISSIPKGPINVPL
ncbi:MAG: hypothetical protein ACP5NV_06780 [Candidatus Woesearchaeota archaeon]